RARWAVARRRRIVAEPDRDRPRKTLFRVGTAAPARQFGSVSAGPRPDRSGVRGPDRAGGVDAGLAVAAPSPHLCDAAAARRIEPALRHPRRDFWPRRADSVGAARQSTAPRT